MRKMLALLMVGVLLFTTACAGTSSSQPQEEKPASQQPAAEHTPAKEQTPAYILACLTDIMQTGTEVSVQYRANMMYRFLVTQEFLDALQTSKWQLIDSSHEELNQQEKTDDQSLPLLEILFKPMEGQDFWLSLDIRATFIGVGIVRYVETEEYGTTEHEFVCYTVPQENPGDFYNAVLELIKENKTFFAS